MRTCSRQAAPCCMLHVTRTLMQSLNAYLQVLMTGLLSISNPNKVATLQRPLLVERRKPLQSA